jgi:hypothetical protein
LPVASPSLARPGKNAGVAFSAQTTQGTKVTPPVQKCFSCFRRLRIVRLPGARPFDVCEWFFHSPLVTCAETASVRIRRSRRCELAFTALVTHANRLCHGDPQVSGAGPWGRWSGVAGSDLRSGSKSMTLRTNRSFHIARSPRLLADRVRRCAVSQRQGICKPLPNTKARKTAYHSLISLVSRPWRNCVTCAPLNRTLGVT